MIRKQRIIQAAYIESNQKTMNLAENKRECERHACPVGVCPVWILFSHSSKLAHENERPNWLKQAKWYRPSTSGGVITRKHTLSIIIHFLKRSLSIHFCNGSFGPFSQYKTVIKQLDLVSDFDLFALQFYLIKLEIHLDCNKVHGLFSLSCT